MKKIFLLLLFITSFVSAQSLELQNRITASSISALAPEMWYALDLDGSTEYAYINNPTGLDLNSANYLSGSDADMTAVYESDFSSGVDGWGTFRAPIVGNINAHGQTDLLAMVDTSNGIYIYKSGFGLVELTTHHIQFDYYIKSSTATEVRLQEPSQTLLSITPTLNAWASVDTMLTCDSDVSDLRLLLSDETTGDSLYLKNIINTPTNYTSNGDTEISFAEDELLASVDNPDLFEQDPNYLYPNMAKYLDLDGSTEYAYIDNPSGLDLNGVNLIDSSYNQDMTAVYESDFSSGVNGWAVVTGDTPYGNIDAHDSTDLLSIPATSPDIYIYRGMEGTYPSYNLRMDYYMKSSTATEMYHEYSNITNTTLVLNEWASMSVMGSNTNTIIRIAISDEAIGDTLYIKNIRVTETNYTSNGDTEISFASDKMEVVASKDEEVVNGGFADSSNWTISSDSLTITDGKLNFVNAPNFSLASQLNGLTIGRRYIISYEVSDYVSGSVKLKGGTSSPTITANANGTYSEIVTATMDDVFIQCFAEGTTLKVDNISVIPTPTSSDYISISQDNFTSTMEHGKKYTVQFKGSSDGNLGSDLLSGWDFTTWSVLSGDISAISSDSIFTGTVGNIRHPTSNGLNTGYYQYHIKGTMTGSDGTFQLMTNSNQIIKNIEGLSFDITGIYENLTGDRLQFRSTSTTNDTVWIEEFSVKPITYSDLAIKVGNGHGVDLVTNGGFDEDTWWVKESGWTISNGTANCNTSSNIALYKSSLLTIGETYQVTFDITDYTSGNITVRLGGYGTARNAVGTYTENIIATNESFQLRAFDGISTSGFVGSIDNVSVYKIGTTHTTTGTSATKAYTFTYDSTGMTVLDDNMETDKGWVGHGQDIGDTLYLSATKKYTGSQSIYCNVDGISEGIRSPYYTIDEGQTALLTFWYYIESGDIIIGNYLGNVVPVPTTLTTTGTWQEAEIKINWVADGNDKVLFTSTAAAEFYIDDFNIQKLPSIQFLPQANDTYYVDKVDISEAFDLEIEGWFKFDNANDGIIFDFTKLGGYSGLTLCKISSQLRLYHVGDMGNEFPTPSYLPSTSWEKFNIAATHKTTSLSVNDSIIHSGANEDYEDIGVSRVVGFSVGTRMEVAYKYMSGQIGNITFTRTNGLGETVGTSIYDWKGTSDTFLDDKGSNGNDLSGVNITLADVDSSDYDSAQENWEYLTKGDYTDSTWSWIPYGNNLVEVSGNKLKITYVDDDNGAYLYLRDTYDLSADLEVGAEYVVSFDGYVNTGSVSTDFAGGVTVEETATITNTTPERIQLRFTASSANGIYFRFADMGTGEIIYIDNLEIKKLPDENDNLVLSQDNLTYPFEHGKNYTMQFDTYSDGNAVEVLNKNEWSDSSWWTTVGSITTIYSDSIIIDATSSMSALIINSLFEDGKAYEYYFNVTEKATSTANMTFYDGTSTPNIAISETGEYTGIYYDGDYSYDNNGNCYLFATSGAQFTIDSFWVKEITYSDLAIKVGNGHGVDLVTNGDFSDGSTDWSLGTEWSVIDGQVIGVDGTGGYLYTPITLDKDDEFFIEYDVISNDGATLSTQGTGSGIGNNGNVLLPSIVGTNKSQVIKNTNSGTILLLSVSGDGTIILDNIHLYKIGTTHSTTGTEATYAYTFKYDSSGMTTYDHQFTNDNEGWLGQSGGSITHTGNETVYFNSDGSGTIIFSKASDVLDADKYYRYHTRLRHISGEYNIFCLRNFSSTDTAFAISDDDWQTFSGEFTPNAYALYSGIDIRNSTSSAVYEVDYFVIEELPSLQLLPLANDTYTIDDVDVSEAYDLSIEGWFKRNTSLSGRLLSLYQDSGNLIEVYSYLDRFYKYVKNNGAATAKTYYSVINQDQFYKYTINTKKNDNSFSLKLDDVLQTDATSYRFDNINHFTQLTIGAEQNGGAKFTGQIGKTTITRTNGLGETVGTSIYDWDGTSDTFLRDKGSNGNHLIGINITKDLDVVKYKGGYD